MVAVACSIATLELPGRQTAAGRGRPRVGTELRADADRERMADARGKPRLLQRHIGSSSAIETGAVHMTSPVAGRVMRARTSHDRSVFCNSPLSIKSACGAELAGGAIRGADTRIFSIFANPSARRVVTFAAMAVRFTVMIGGGNRHHRNGGRSASEPDVQPDHRRDDGQRDDRAESSNGERRRAAQAK